MLAAVGVGDIAPVLVIHPERVGNFAPRPVIRPKERAFRDEKIILGVVRVLKVGVAVVRVHAVDKALHQLFKLSAGKARDDGEGYFGGEPFGPPIPKRAHEST